MNNKTTLLLLLFLLICACGRQEQVIAEEGKYPTLTVERKDHQVEVEYAAQIRGKQDIRIIPRVEGYLQSILVKEGERVKQNQLLFIIDQVHYQAALRSAKAAVLQSEALAAKAEQNYEGEKILRERNVISDFELKQSILDLDIANANVETARAEEETAKNNLSFTELRSPSDGVIGRLPYRKGDYVGPAISDGLTVVSDNSKMYVYFSMTEARAMEYLQEFTSMQGAISHMPELSLSLANGTTYNKKGKIESISGIVDNQTGAVSVRAVFPNESGILLSGGTGRVIFPKTYKNAIVIPQEATFEIQDKVYVYKVVDGKAFSVIINVERIHDGNEFIVTNGLEEGDTIISKGAGFVHEGAVINTDETSK